MGIFELIFKKRTPRGDARWREKEMMDSLGELIDCATVEQFDQLLRDKFKIDRKDTRYAEIRKIFDAEKQRR